jgi:hypothetical protein
MLSNGVGTWAHKRWGCRCPAMTFGVRMNSISIQANSPVHWRGCCSCCCSKGWCRCWCWENIQGGGWR